MSQIQKNSNSAYPNQFIITGEKPQTSSKNFSIIDNRINEAVMRHFAKHPTYFFVYIYLCKLGSEKTKWYWHPTTAAKITGLSRPTVNTAFKALEEDEFLVKTHKSSSNTYYSFTREPHCIYLELQQWEEKDEILETYENIM